MYDLIVIGGGAAALSATAYGLGKQMRVLMISELVGGKTAQPLQVGREGGEAAGGGGEEQAAWSEAAEAGHMFGEESVGRFARQVRAQPGVAMSDYVAKVQRNGEGFEVQTLRHGWQQGTSVVLATGVTPVRLGVPGTERFLGYGLGYSATTYAPQLRGRRVAVIGNTRRALRGAAELAQFAEQVYVIARTPPVGRAQEQQLIEALRACPNVELLDDYQVIALEGDEQLERVVVMRRAQQRPLAASAAFADLGLRPNSGPVRELAQLDAEGFIVVDERNATSVPGLFAAGDVSTMAGEQVLIAIGDGARAALGAYDHVLGTRLASGQRAVAAGE